MREVDSNSPEIRPQIDNLPSTQSSQHTHRPKSKPFYTLIRTFISISQFLFPSPHVLQFSDDFLNHLLDSAEVGFDGLEFLLGLDGGPVSRVGADVDVQFYLAGRVCAGFCFLNS